MKTEVLREIVDVISTLIDEAKFTIGKNGITVKAVDPAHVAMVDLSMTKEGFEGYNTTEGELGLNIDKVKEVLKLAKVGDSIEIRHDEDKNRLVFVVGNVTRWMALVDTAGMSDPKLPNLNLTAKVVMRTENLKHGIRASESVSDHISLKASPDGFEMISESATDAVELKLPKELLEDLECKEPTKSMFPLEYFSNMIKAIGTSGNATLYLGNDYPVRLEFDIAAGKGHVKYLLAPRVDKE